MTAGRPRRLVIVSHVVHYSVAGRLYAYGPYAREIDIWADLFPDVVIAAPCRREQPPDDALPFSRTNIRIAPQPERGGDTIGAKLAQIASLPAMARDLARTLRRADAIHVRCPGNLGLLGAVLAPMYSSRLIAKYAGQWNGYRGEPMAVRLQRWILGSPWWRGPVTVYGQWPSQPAHVVPFFTSMMDRGQLARAARIASTRRLRRPLRVLFSGVLTSRKRAHALIEAVALTRAQGVAVELALVGNGPDRQALENLVRAAGLHECVHFIGALPFDEALRWYEWGDCLVLPSRHSEGWPKVVAEAMSFGLVCVAVDHGQLRTMLGGRGHLLPTGSAEEIAAALVAIAADPIRHEQLGREASHWARQYSLEGLRSAIGGLLTRWWHVPVAASPVETA